MGPSIVQDVVIRNLQVLAESSQRLSEQIKQTRPEIDWHKISGFRNILVHDYLGIDMERVWIIVEREIPLPKKTVRAMMG